MCVRNLKLININMTITASLFRPTLLISEIINNIKVWNIHVGTMGEGHKFSALSKWEGGGFKTFWNTILIKKYI